MQQNSKNEAVESASREAPLTDAEEMGNYVKNAFGQAGIANYCFGLFTGDASTFLIDGKFCAESEAEQARHRSVRLGCLFKPLVAAVALEISQKGHLRLESPVGDVLPELAGDEKGRSIQIRHLMSHTAGYLGFSTMPPTHRFHHRASALSVIREAPQIFLPGDVFNHDYSGTAILGEILEEITQASVPELITDSVFDPLQINCTFPPQQASFDASDSEFSLNGPRQLAGTTLSFPDLLTLLAHLLGVKYHSSEPACLTAQTRSSLQLPVVRIPRTPHTPASRLLPIGHSLGLQLFQNGICGYDGHTGAEVVGFRFNRASNTGVVLATTFAGRALKRTVLSRIVESMPNVPTSTFDQTFEVEAQDESAALDIVGDYAGDNSLHANVREYGRQIMLTVKSGRDERFQVRGVRESSGSLSFAPKIPGLEPSFFYYAPTGDVGLMFGMFAMKRMRGIGGKKILSKVKSAPRRIKAPEGSRGMLEISRNAEVESRVPDDNAKQAAF